jgi:hypothetical protein
VINSSQAAFALGVAQMIAVLLFYLSLSGRARSGLVCAIGTVEEGSMATPSILISPYSLGLAAYGVKASHNGDTL